MIRYFQGLTNDDIFSTEDNQFLMFGTPVVKSNDTLCMLYQNNVTVAYSNVFNSPQILATVVSNHMVNMFFLFKILVSNLGSF